MFADRTLHPISTPDAAPRAVAGPLLKSRPEAYMCAVEMALCGMACCMAPRSAGAVEREM